MATRPAPTGAEGAPGPGQPGFDAWVLCREFVDRIVSDAQAAAARDNPGHPVPEVDWESIWRAGDGAPSDESAIGRIIRAASVVAHGIVLRTSSDPLSPVERVDSEVGPAAAPTRQPPAGDAPVGPAAPVAPDAPVVTIPAAPSAPGEPVSALVEPVGGAVEPVTALVEPVSASADPVTAPVDQVTSVVRSGTLDRADPRATMVVEPAGMGVLLTDPRVAGEIPDDGVAMGRVTRTHSEWATFFTWIRNLGAIMLLFVVWQLWGTAVSQHQAQSQLQAAFEASLRAHHAPKATASGPSLVPASTSVPSPPEGSVLAELQIPAIGSDQYVVVGTSAADLSKGPGHYVGSAMPGQAGNVAIAGHRTTHGAPFNRLGNLVHGDRIVLTTTSGQRLTYVVSGPPQTVSPGDVAVLNYFGDNRITLTTCTPEFSAAQRLVVVGELKQHITTPEPPAKHLAYHIVNPATASWDWSLLPVVGVEVSLLLLLGLSYRRFGFWYGNSAKWFILVPIWAAGLYLLFDSLTTFLPASF